MFSTARRFRVGTHHFTSQGSAAIITNIRAILIARRAPPFGLRVCSTAAAWLAVNIKLFRCATLSGALDGLLRGVLFVAQIEQRGHHVAQRLSPRRVAVLPRESPSRPACRNRRPCARPLRPRIDAGNARQADQISRANRRHQVVHAHARDNLQGQHRTHLAAEYDGWPTENYLPLEHPVQQLILSTIAVMDSCLGKAFMQQWMAVVCPCFLSRCEILPFSVDARYR